MRRVIAQLPTQRQTLLFSATMPRVIVDLSKKLLIDPVTVYATPKQTTVERVTQELLLVPGNASKQRHLLAALEERQPVRAIVFSRTKHGANKIAKQVNANSAFTAMAIHGNKSQSAREQALSSFKSGETRVLVATDVAGRRFVWVLVVLRLLCVGTGGPSSSMCGCRVGPSFLSSEHRHRLGHHPLPSHNSARA